LNNPISPWVSNLNFTLMEAQKKKVKEEEKKALKKEEQKNAKEKK
jgi:hypothetical protein